MEQMVTNNVIEDKKICIAIMSSYVILSIQYLILVYFDFVGTDIGLVVQLTSKGIVGFYYLKALPIILKRSKIKVIIIYFISIFLYLFNFVFFNENWIYLKSIFFPVFFICLPTFIYAYSINDWDILMVIIRKTSKIVFCVGVLILILSFSGNISIGTYSMSLSYYMLLPTVVYMNDSINKFSIKASLIVLLSLFIILSLGSRGPIMCFGVFIILMIIKQMRELTPIKVLKYLIVLIFAIVIIVYFESLITYMNEIFTNYGINSRTLRLLQREGIYLSGRDRIYEEVLDAIRDKPLGLGLAADRRILSGKNAYVHNIFIEIMLNFGVILGSIVNIFLLILLVKSIFLKDINRYNMISIWISLGFAQLLVSSSYLIDFKFWILLGLMFKSFSIKK